MEKSGKAEGQGLEYLQAVRVVFSGHLCWEESINVTFVFQAPLKIPISQREHLIGCACVM